MNLASPNNKVRHPSRKLLKETCKVASTFGAKGVVVHGGSVGEGGDIGEGYKNWAKAIKEVEINTSFMADLEFQSGAIIQAFLSFDVINHQRNHMELYGTKGSIIVPDPNMFGGPVYVSFTEGGEWQEKSVEEMVQSENMGPQKWTQKWTPV